MIQIAKRTRTWIVIVAVALAMESWALYVVGISPDRWRPAMIVKDEPAARAVYEAMIQAMRSAQTLSYSSVCGDAGIRMSLYKIYLGKPDLFRIEMFNDPSKTSNILVGDGKNLWLFWSGGRPYLNIDDSENYEKTKSDVYVRRAPLANDGSIADQVARFGIAWFPCILDPSVFHGHAGILDPYMDGICSRGTDKIEGEKCDVIEISFFKAQRTWHLWISQRDHLPRRVKEIVRCTDNKITVEEWSDIVVNGAVPPATFAWSPPVDWRLWTMPTLQDQLARSGQEAPGFELRASDGGEVKLSDCRGKVVWLYLWQCGSPQCRQELPHLQSLYEKHKESGLTVLGVNVTDDERIVRAFLRENPLTFPILHDCSLAARGVAFHYGNKTAAMPMSCIIDREGKIVDAWLGYEGNHKRAMTALEKAGLPLTPRN